VAARHQHGHHNRHLPDGLSHSEQAKLDELIRAVDKAREQFIGIEHLTDEQIELVRAALEKHAQQLREKPGKKRTTEDTVDRLLKRF
jgi:low affinity Fe/Cu permease